MVLRVKSHEVVLGYFSNFVFNQPGLEIILMFDALEKESVSLVGHFGWSHHGEFFRKSDDNWLEAQWLSGELAGSLSFWECWLQFRDCLQGQSG